MSASYPTSTKSFSTKTNGSAIAAAHVDDLQDEVVAVENDLRSGLPVTRGGTGILTGTSGGVPYFSAATTMASSAVLTASAPMIGGGAGAAPKTVAAMTNGQVLVGSTGADPVPAAITAGAGISVTLGAGTIAIANTLSGYTLTRVTTQFDKTNATLGDITGLSLTLTSSVKYNFKATLHVTLDATGGWKIGFGGTATATAFRATVMSIIFAVGNPTLATGTALATTYSSTGPTFAVIYVEGYIDVNAGGTLTLQFAQSSANGTSSVMVGSNLVLFP